MYFSQSFVVHSLTLDHGFNQSLEGIQLPSILQSWTFGSNFNQNLEGIQLPSSMQSLTLGESFGRSFEGNHPPVCEISRHVGAGVLVWLPLQGQMGRMLQLLLGLPWFLENFLRQLFVVVRPTGTDVVSAHAAHKPGE
ncbi:cmbB [Symbiodinium necroappetens]|uniref:CmbB protein n=1 Tax=Symbiodinium necroappetens TaxID=1628268 RepID=A0A812LUS4_9DINO|nr:cmbB [Symbiodinium necroappetens]